MTIRVLTGITTTGTPHLGNYAGAIRPAIAASARGDVDAYFFLADYHALVKCDDAARVARSRLELAATWLACGLDPERVTFYRQSDIPEIAELCWLLTCVAPKGLMNRAHAYKASVDQNAARGADADDGVTMGLFCYPILMAADILAFNAHQVPVGRDQVQHLEMARDMAQRFNHLYGGEYFVLPEAVVEADVAVLPGLDGRKMSKSYNNTIPLFEGGAPALRAAVARIVTDSRAPGEAKPDARDSHLITLYQAFATPAETAELLAALAAGMGWGEAKDALTACLERTIAPMRERYQDLMSHPARIEDILQTGAQKARRQTVALLQRLRHAVGLRQFVDEESAVAPSAADNAATNKTRRARFVSFRDTDGSFRFRLLAVTGEELLCSERHQDPKAAGALMRRLPLEAELHDTAQGCEALLDGALIAQGQGSLAQTRQALASLALLP